MKVTVRAFGAIREAAGLAYGEPRELEIADAAAVTDALSALGLAPEQVVHVLIDGVAATQQDELHHGAELTLMPAFTGGS